MRIEPRELLEVLSGNLRTLASGELLGGVKISFPARVVGIPLKVIANSEGNAVTIPG